LARSTDSWQKMVMFNCENCFKNRSKAKSADEVKILKNRLTVFHFNTKSAFVHAALVCKVYAIEL